MDNVSFLSWLFLVTIILAVAVAVWQLVRVQRAKQRHGDAGRFGHRPSDAPLNPPPADR